MHYFIFSPRTETLIFKVFWLHIFKTLVMARFCIFNFSCASFFTNTHTLINFSGLRKCVRMLYTRNKSESLC